MMNIEDVKMSCERVAERRIEMACDPTLRLQEHTVYSCPGTSFTKLMVECMNREPHFPHGGV